MKKKHIFPKAILPIGDYTPSISVPDEFMMFIRDTNIAKEKAFLSEHLLFEEKLTTLYLRNVSNIQKYSGVYSINTRKYGKVIIVDPYTFYIPYHINARLYGIYFRARNILEAFMNFASLSYKAIKEDRMGFLKRRYPDRWMEVKQLVNDVDAFITSFFIVFVVFIYFHALSHHIIEDVSTYLEVIGKGKYSPFKRTEEESFCSWVSFTTLEGYKIPEILYQSKKVERLLRMFHPILPRIPREDIIDVTYFAIPLLYAFFTQRETSYPKPLISKNVSRFLSVIWEPMRLLHFTYEVEPVKINDVEIFERLFVTTY